MRLLSAVTIFAGSCLLVGCAMLTSWKAIPPPGGCDQCHSIEITANWSINYQVAHLTDERGREDFQTAAGSMPTTTRPVWMPTRAASPSGTWARAGEPPTAVAMAMAVVGLPVDDRHRAAHHLSRPVALPDRGGRPQRRRSPGRVRMP